MSAMFDIDTKDIKILESHLKAFHHRALPFATKATLNTIAFQAMKDGRRTVAIDMINRNKFTQQSIQVRQARTLNIRQQQSAFGSTQAYMETQEFGGITKKAGKNQAVIPTSAAAGQDGTKPRTKLPRRANKIQNIQLAKKLVGGKFKSKRQRVFITALVAARAGQKNVFINDVNAGGRNSSAIYKVQGLKKRNGRFTNVKMKMLYRMDRQPAPIKKSPWMRPAVDYVETRVPAYYRDALLFQLRRQGSKLKLR